MQRTIVFDNTGSESPKARGRALLSPLTDLRAVFDVRTGALTTLERLTLRARLHDLARPDGLIVPERLVALTRERHGPHTRVNDASTLAESVLLVNGACPLADTDSTGVEQNECVVDGAAGVLVKANVARADVPRVLAGDLARLNVREVGHAVLTRPWHVRTHRDACIAADLAMLTKARGDWVRLPPPTGSPGEGPSSVYAATSAAIHPTAVFDTERGPVLIDEHATVRPLAVVVGPAYIGPYSTVIEHAFIKGNTALGPHCKAAGEVGGTIVQGYSNKAHDGHLGDSWLGEWVNLGAGTTNSNLLNTYGDVIARATTDGSNERTGETFLGCILGDHVKTAICTRIMTGAIVGTGTMWAASAPVTGFVPAFSWITDGEPANEPSSRPYRFEKFMDVARAAMGRRKVVGSEAYAKALQGLCT